MELQSWCPYLLVPNGKVDCKSTFQHSIKAWTECMEREERKLTLFLQSKLRSAAERSLLLNLNNSSRTSSDGLLFMLPAAKLVLSSVVRWDCVAVAGLVMSFSTIFWSIGSRKAPSSTISRVKERDWRGHQVGWNWNRMGRRRQKCRRGRKHVGTMKPMLYLLFF